MLGGDAARLIKGVSVAELVGKLIAESVGKSVGKSVDRANPNRIVLLFYNEGLDQNHWMRVKFIIDNMWLIGLAFLSGSFLLWNTLQQRGSQLSLLETTKLINQGKAAILDVRDALDFSSGHIRDARNIPAKELAQRVGELDKLKSKTIILVCGSGVQSGRATTVLRKAGFAEVYSLSGGLAAWHTQGMPIAK
jgi:rhodanese-related sulfurtransferase